MDKCPACHRYSTRGVTVDAVIGKGEKILLVKRKNNPFKNLWALPGGHLDFNETLEDAVAREVKEETGLRVKSLKFFGIYSNPKRHPEQAVAVIFEVKVVGVPRAGDDALEAKFFSFNSLPKDLAFDHGEIIGDYLRLLRLG